MGIRKLWYSIFKRKAIDKVYQTLINNYKNPQYIKSNDRINQYIKLGFYNPYIIEIAERRFFAVNKYAQKLNAKENKYGKPKSSKRYPSLPRQTERIENAVVEEPEYNEPEYNEPEPTDRDRRYDRRPEPKYQPRTTAASYSDRTRTDRETSKQRSLSTRESEKPVKRTGYFD